MTGSAFARYELRGTFHLRVLRAFSGIEGESEGERVSGSSLNRSLWADFFWSFSRVLSWNFLVKDGTRTYHGTPISSGLNMDSPC